MPALGWRLDAERRVHLAETELAFRLRTPFVAPREIDHRGWLAVENQWPLGSCTGHARSTCAEICNWIDTGGSAVQLSRMFAYLTAQQEDGLRGDQGATIDGAVAASRKYGECLETTFPYPPHYTPEIPPAAFDEARGHRLRNHALLRSYDDLYAWLASGVGPVILGIVWVESLVQAGATVEVVSGRRYGGHAMAITGYTARTQGARRYLILTNSHGREWGANGHTELAPRVVDRLLADGSTVAIGVSDLEEYAVRDYMLL